MEDPVIDLKSGKIFDRSWIQSSSNSEPDHINMNIFPLNDLKQVINKYQCLDLQNTGSCDEAEEWYPNKKQKVLCSCQSCEECKDNAQISKVVKNYKVAVDEVKSQDSIVEVSKASITIFSDQLVKSVTSLQAENQKFFQTVQNLSQIGSHDDSYKILEVKEQLASSNLKLQQLIENNMKSIMKLYHKRLEFEQNLQKLKKIEEDLQKSRIHVEGELQKTGIIPQFTELVEDLSKKHHHPKQVNEEELRKLFQSGYISNVSVHLQSTNICCAIEVKGSVRVKKLNVTSSQNGVCYLKIYTHDKNASIYFEDCNFEGIGLFLCGDIPGSKKRAGFFQCKNIAVRNAREAGFAIEQIENCLLTKVVVKKSALYGFIFSNICKCIAQFLSVDGCGGSGIKLYETFGEIVDSQISNCLKYGIYVNSNIVRVRNVEFRGNIKGESQGQLIIM